MFIKYFRPTGSRMAQRPGYIFLVSVLVMGAIASATAVSLLLLGWAAEQNGQTVAQAGQAYEYSYTCVERALRTLRQNPNYGGDETFSFEYGECEIESIGGNGNTNRTICARGESGDSVRRLQLSVTRLMPSTLIASWEEVPTFTLCP